MVVTGDNVQIVALTLTMKLFLPYSIGNVFIDCFLILHKDRVSFLDHTSLSPKVQ